MAAHVSEHDVYERQRNYGFAFEPARSKLRRKRMSPGERALTATAVALLLFLGSLIFHFHASEPGQTAANTVRMDFAQLDIIAETLPASPPAAPPFNR